MAALTLATGLYLGASSATVSVSAATAPSVPSLPALPAASGGTTGVRQSQVPPVPSIPVGSPVAFFRELLKLKPEEQEARLAARTPESRAVLERKLKEYQAMDPQEREWRLKGVEFHYYNRLLLTAPAEFRSQWLQSLPAEYRGVCAERLKLWSILPPELQKHLLARENTMQLLSRLERVQGADRAVALEGLSESERAQVKAEMERWKSMPAGQPAQWTAGFKSLFDLTGAEQEKLRKTLVAAHQTNAMELVAQARTISPQNRERTLEGIKRFTQLSAEQRARFLESYTRWKKLPEADREIWRRLVNEKAAVITLPVAGAVGGVPKG